MRNDSAPWWTSTSSPSTTVAPRLCCRANELRLAGPVDEVHHDLAVTQPIGLDLLTPGDQDRLVGHLLLQGGACRHQVVGEDPRAGIAYVGLERLRAAGDLGLLAEPAPAALDLDQQVVEPGQVALGGVEACGAPSPCACGA